MNDTLSERLSDTKSYDFYFTRSNPAWSKRTSYNHMFLQAQLAHHQHRLETKGIVFLNEVLDTLEMQRVSHGQLVGWIMSRETNGQIDYEIHDEEDDIIRIHFIVDGLVWHRLPGGDNEYEIRERF